MLRGYEKKLCAIERSAKQQVPPLCILTRRDGTQEAYYGYSAVPVVISGEYVRIVTDDEDLAFLLSTMGGKGLSVERMETRAILKQFRQLQHQEA